MGRSAGRRASGFTIVEVLLAGALGVMVIGGAYMVYDAGQSTTAAGQRKVDLQQNARTALDLLTWQIRHAGYLNLGTVRNRIAIGAPTLLVVRGDVNLTGGTALTDTLFAVQPNQTAMCPAPPCLVTGTDVYTVNPAQVVTAFNIPSITFTYLDQNNIVLPTPLDGVGAGAYPDGAAASNPLPGPTTNRDAVRNIRVTLTGLDATVSAGPGAGSTPQQIVLTSNVRFRETN